MYEFMYTYLCYTIIINIEAPEGGDREFVLGYTLWLVFPQQKCPPPSGCLFRCKCVSKLNVWICIQSVLDSNFPPGKMLTT